MMARHAALVDAIRQDFARHRHVLRILTVEAALQDIRTFLYPATTSRKDRWKPKLHPCQHADTNRSEGRRTGITMMPETPDAILARDFSNLGVPSFHLQLADEDAEVIDSRTVRIGDTLFAGFDVTVAPELLLPFNALVDAVSGGETAIAWRASLLIEPGGQQGLRLKEQYARLLAFASPSRNGRIRQAIDRLRQADGVDDTIVKLRMSFATWSSRPETLGRQAAALRRAVERWGNAVTDAVTGDMLATVLASAGGITLESTAPPAAAPLASALAMCPVARAAGPWREGAVLFRTGDGKVWPYQPGSSRQTSWVDVFAGAPGTGKSVSMHALNLATLLAPHAGSDRNAGLPRLAIIDVGESARGLIDMVRDALPRSRKSEAVHLRVKMSADHAINPFDTLPGMRRLLQADRMFLGNVMAILCSDGISKPAGPMAGLASHAIDQAYAELGDHRNPRRYHAGEEPAVDRALQDMSIHPGDHATWWQVVDGLFACDRTREAETAQRLAVPTLVDLIHASRAEQIVSLYGKTMDAETGQPLLEAFHRIIAEAVRDYPVLASPTRCDHGSARITALDLGEVMTPGSTVTAEKRAALMFMIARHAAMRGWFLDDAEIRAAARDGAFPEIYLARHLKDAAVSQQTPKLICMDEFHRASVAAGVQEQILQDMREGRKHNIRIALASQMISDFPDAILALASNLNFIWLPCR